MVMKRENIINSIKIIERIYWGRIEIQYSLRGE